MQISRRASVHPWRAWLYAFGALVLLALAWHSRDALSEVLASLRPGRFVGAVVVGVALTTAQGLFFGLLLRKNGSSVSLRGALVAYLVSQPGKYVPGKIWAPLMQKASMGKDSSLISIGASNVELAAVSLMQMGSLGGACLAMAHPATALTLLAAGVVIGALLLRLRALAMVSRSLPAFGDWLGIDPVMPAAPPIPALVAIGLSLGVMTLTLAASWLVLMATGLNYPVPEQATLLGTLFMGFGLSLLMFFVPAGLGVREAVTAGIGIVTAPGFSESQLIAVALVARAWQLAVDLACLFLGLVLGLPRRGA